MKLCMVSITIKANPYKERVLTAGLWGAEGQPTYEMKA